MVQTAQKEQSEHLQRPDILQRVSEKSWFAIGKGMARCIFTVNFAMFPSQRKTSGTASIRNCTSG